MHAHSLVSLVAPSEVGSKLTDLCDSSLFYKYGPAIREKCKFAREADVLNKQLMEAAQAKFQKDAAR